MTKACCLIPISYHLTYCALLQIKEAAVRLARLYMKRVSGELDQIVAGSEKEPFREFLLLQGVRFAFRVHQVHHFNLVLNKSYSWTHYFVLVIIVRLFEE